MIQVPGGIRIGEILVAQGILTRQQVNKILSEQRHTHRPFGDLAERLFGVSSRQVEEAWVNQYLSYGTEVDLRDERVDDQVLSVVTRRQAWQFRLLPLHWEEGELLIATCRTQLRRAVNFAWNRLQEPVYFLVGDERRLEEMLKEHYPWPGAEHLQIPGL